MNHAPDAVASLYPEMINQSWETTRPARGTGRMTPSPT